MSFFWRRAAHGILLAFAVSLLSFGLFELVPGDFFDEMRLNPQISPATVAALRARYGMDRPLPERYARWLLSVGRGEMGYSFAYGSPVGPLLRDRALHTLALAGTATLLAWLIAIPVGVFGAARRGRWSDRISSAGTSLLLAVPDVVIALGLLLLAVRTGAFPVGGMRSPGFSDLGPWGQAWDLVSHAALPVSALVLGALPVLVRHVRASMIEALSSPFARAARGHGIPRRRLLFHHALPAAAKPVLALVGFSVASLLSMSLLVEVVMSWPGLGPLLLEAILARDLYVVVGAVVVSTVFLLAGNLVADLLLYAADPRIRTETLR
jgi:peptide/nickel transport system permease protein